MMDANQLRSTFTGFYAERGPRRRPLGQPHPPRPHRAVHHRRHGPVQAVLPGRGAAPLAPGHVGAEVLPHRRHRHRRAPPSGTARSSRCSATSASATTSRPTPSPSRGSCSPRCSASTPSGCGSPCTRPTTRPRRSGSTRSGVPEGRVQRLGEDNFWQMGDSRAVRPVLGAVLRPRARPTARTADPPTAGPSASSRSTTWCSCSTTGWRDGTLADLPGKSIDTGAGLERNLPVLQGVRVAVRDRRLPPHPGRGRGHHRGPLRRRRPLRRVAAHPGRPRPGHGHGGGRRRAALQRGPGLRPAPDHPPGRAPGLPARGARAP